MEAPFNHLKYYPKLMFLGDKVKAQKKAPYGIAAFQALTNLMRFQDLKQHKLQKVYSDGTIITAHKFFNEGVVYIFVPLLEPEPVVTGEVEIHDYVLAIIVRGGSKKYSFLWDMRNHEYYYIPDPNDPSKSISYPCAWFDLEDFVDLYEYKYAIYHPPEERLLYNCFGTTTPFGAKNVTPPPTTGGEETSIGYCGEYDTPEWKYFSDEIASGTVVEPDVSGCGTFANTRMQTKVKSGIRKELTYSDEEYAYSYDFVEDMRAYTEEDIHYLTGLPYPDNWGYYSFGSKYYEILTDAGNGEPYCCRTTRNTDHSNSYNRSVYVDYGGCPVDVRMGCVGSGEETTLRSLIMPHKTFTYKPYSLVSSAATSAFGGSCTAPGWYDTRSQYETNEMTYNNFVVLGNYTNHIMVQSSWVHALYRDHASIWDTTIPHLSHWTHDFSNIDFNWECRFLYNIYTDAATDHDPRDQKPNRTKLENIIEDLGHDCYDNEGDYPGAAFRILDVTGKFDA